MLFEEFEAGLTPALLGCVEVPEGNVDERRKPSNHRGRRPRGSRQKRGLLGNALEGVPEGEDSEDPQLESEVDENGNPFGDYQGSMDYWGFLGIDPNNPNTIINNLSIGLNTIEWIISDPCEEVSSYININFQNIFITLKN